MPILANIGSKLANFYRYWPISPNVSPMFAKFIPILVNPSMYTIAHGDDVGCSAQRAAAAAAVVGFSRSPYCRMVSST